MASIQGRLTVYIAAGCAVLLAVTGTVIDQLLRERLADDFDDNLHARAMALVSLTEQDMGVVEFDFVAEFMPEYEASERPGYFDLRLMDGTVLGRSPSLGEGGLSLSEELPSEPLLTDVELPDGRPGRQIELVFVPIVDVPDPEELDGAEDVTGAVDEAEPATVGSGTVEGEGTDGDPEADAAEIGARIAVARGREQLDALLASIRFILAAAFMVLLAAVIALIRFSVGRGLEPLHRIAAEVSALDARNLRTRFRLPDSAELRPIASQLNDLLERLDEAFQREKRFSGNVAHELRTPIAELRALAEVGGKWPADEMLVRGFFGDLVNLAEDMERTVGNLLVIARLDAGQQVVDLQSIDLRVLVDGTWRLFERDARLRGVRFDNRIDPAVRVQSDRDKLLMILGNLLSNAVDYSPDESEIVIEARRSESRISVSVSNRTIDLTERDLPLLFERFWRKDQARTGGRHAGLGLSVVKALAEVLDHRIIPRIDRQGRFTVTLSDILAA
jgi:two-component system sensor histidine kinase QseC